MPLNLRQQLLYTDLVDLYPTTTPMTGALGQTGPPMFDASKVYRNVPCRYTQTPETDESTLIGRTKAVNIFTLDKMKIASYLPIEDGWGVVLRTPNHVDNGAFFIAQGNAKRRQSTSFRKTDNQMVYLKRGPRPKGFQE